MAAAFDVSTVGLPAEVVELNETDATVTVRVTGPDGTSEALVLSALAAQQVIRRCEEEISQRARLVHQLRAGLRALAGPLVPGMASGPALVAATGPGEVANDGRPNHTLRRLRERRNLSQAELAEEIRATARGMGLNLACDEKRVSRWERGEVRWPSPAYRRVLCAVFEVASAAELGFRPPQSRG